jgi:ankyrin repeat protein
MKLRNKLRMKLDISKISDAQFLFVTINGHAAEFERILTGHKQDIVSLKAKKEALNEIMRTGSFMDPSVSLTLFSLIGTQLTDATTNGIFMWATKTGQSKLLKILLDESRVILNCQDDYNRSPIHYACSYGHIEIVRILLSDPRVAVTDFSGLQAIHLACDFGHVEIVKLLLQDPRIDPCAKTDNLMEPIHRASQWNRAEVLNLLLGDVRVDANARDDQGDHSLHHAYRHSQINIVRILLNDSRVDLEPINNNGKRPKSVQRSTSVEFE